MSVTPKAITPAQLTATVATYYTCPANTRAIVRAATVCNSAGAAHTYTFYRVPSGGTAGVTNICASAVPIAAGQTLVVQELLGKALGAGDTIQGLADSAAALTFDAAVVEVV